MGDVLCAKGNLNAARTRYSDALAITQKLAAHDPTNTLWKRDLAANYERIGDVLRDQGDLANALKNYRDSYKIR
jgi:predicted negative regulator of RcsB-dependent stress response